MHSAYSSLCKVLQSDRYPVPLTNIYLALNACVKQTLQPIAQKNILNTLKGAPV